MGGNFRVKVGYAKFEKEEKTVASVIEQIKQENTRLVVFFCSSHFDQEKIARAFQDESRDPCFDSATFVGCTTDVAITSRGFQSNSLAAMSINSDSIKVGIGLGKNIDKDPISAARTAVTEAARQLNTAPDRLDDKFVGIVLIDGTCEVEEFVMMGIAKTARRLKTVGGSAGDDYSFNKVFLHLNFETFKNALIFILIRTDAPFATICTNNYLPTSKQLRVTKADPEKRVVYEFNGRPAVSEYCRAIGSKTKDINPETFVAHPLGIKIGDNYYLRSPLRAENDGGLKFFSRITENSSLTVMDPGNLIAETGKAVDTARNKLGKINAMIVFNCCLRYIESEVQRSTLEISKILSAAPVCGFNTYGEQYEGLHINQTLTMLVFGEA
ncbi:MAG: hypothetical protein PWR06_1712 [Thermoanaerobacteraceae bacterium]|nr:hypothetical protein [Thermoanaerobacteraceae bacterium]